MSKATHETPALDKPLARPGPTLERQVLDLVCNWLRLTREANAAHTDAAIDRGSFESFPASDPVASAVATSEREPTLQVLDCRLSPEVLTFHCAPHSDEPDALRPPPAYTLEGAIGDGSHLRLRVWVDDGPAHDPVPRNLTLEPVHASLRARQHERRSGEERRVAAHAVAKRERRQAQRRALLRVDDEPPRDGRAAS